MTKSRLDTARKKLPENKLDAILITSRTNVLYLSGFSGSSGVLLLTEKRNYLITDFRYMEQVSAEAPDVSIVEHKRTLFEAVASKVKQLKTKRLGIEPKSINLEQFNELKGLTTGVRLIPAKDFVEELREVKDAGEVEKIRNALKVGEKALGKVVKSIRPGISELDLALKLEFSMRKCGAQKNAFDSIVATGARSSLPHAKPGPEKVVPGDRILFDWGARVDFYNSDLTRSVFMAKIANRTKRVFQIVLDAQRFAIDTIKSGVIASEVDRAARSYIEKRGFGKQFGHGLGHGIGLDVHESPSINRRNNKPLKAGMVITIEPGIYIPQWGGIRIEDMVLVAEDGCEVLSRFPKQTLL